MTPERIFDGNFLRADLFNGDASRLFVSFRQRIAEPGSFDEPNPVRSFTGHGFAHLHLQSKHNDWYINKDTKALDAALEARCARYANAVSMGFSMGGYAALRFARSIGLTDVLLISAQVSIHPEVVPWDRRYRASARGFKRMTGDVGLYGEAGLRGFALFDPFRRMDRRHADAIHSLFPGILPCRLAGGGHPATQAMRGNGGLRALQAGLRNGTLTRKGVLETHRSARAGSAYYWGRLADHAGAHHKGQLAATAQARADALEAVSKG